MSQDIDYEKFYTRSPTDYLKLGARGLYVIASALFLYGYWIDWKSPGAVVISPLVVADDPHANSGLFVGAFVLVVLGFVIVKMADAIERFQTNEFTEESQDWTLEDRM